MHLQVSNFDQWRVAARNALRDRIPPDQVVWSSADDTQNLLFECEVSEPSPRAASETLRVPRSFVTLAQLVARHSDPARWTLLYRALWRITHGEQQLLDIESDSTVSTLNRLRRAVEKDI